MKKMIWPNTPRPHTLIAKLCSFLNEKSRWQLSVQSETHRIVLLKQSCTARGRNIDFRNH